jgi:hypothetical protein
MYYIAASCCTVYCNFAFLLFAVFMQLRLYINIHTSKSPFYNSIQFVFIYVQI